MAGEIASRDSDVTRVDGSPSLAKLKRYFTEARDLTQQARTNALQAIDYYDSDQFTGDDLAKLHARGQPPVVINRIKPAINGIIGVTEKGRSDPRCWPRNPGDDGQADAATDVLRYIADFNRFKRIKQDCFLDMLVPGTMAALVGVDDDKQVTITQVRWEEFFHDPRSRRKDFKDARFLGIAKWMIWGATLSNRVKTIERDIEPLRLLAASVARLEARLEGLMEQLRELSFSIRWGRSPPIDDHLPLDRPG